MLELGLEKAVSVLNAEGIIIYPTETFYGIGCKISSEKAISSIFQAKKRLLALPLPTIVSNLEQVYAFTQLSSAVRSDVEELAKLFWAGPLTLILPAKKKCFSLAYRRNGHPCRAFEFASCCRRPCRGCWRAHCFKQCEYQRKRACFRFQRLG